jgi:hypothetical protein
VSPGLHGRRIHARAGGQQQLTLSISHRMQMLYPDVDKMLKRMTWAYWAMIFLIVVHIIVIAYTDPIIGVSNVGLALIIG